MKINPNLLVGSLGKILWTNSSPTSVFNPQDMTLSSSDWDYIEIYYNQGQNNSICNSNKVMKGYSSDLIVTTNFNQGTSQVTGTRFRKITYVSATKLHAENAYERATGTQSDISPSNGLVIPLRVIGYKL